MGTERVAWRAIVAGVVALSLHVCCCVRACFAWIPERASVSAACPLCADAPSKAGVDDPGEDTRQGSAPTRGCECPTKGPKLAADGARIEAPPLNEIPWACAGVACPGQAESVCLHRPDTRGGDRAWRGDRSLLRQHCALLV